MCKRRFKTMKIKYSCLGLRIDVIALTLLSFGFQGYAEEEMSKSNAKVSGEQELEVREDRNLNVNSKTEIKAKLYADTFKVSETTILDLRKKGLGWGEINHLFLISKKSGQSVDTIL